MSVNSELDVEQSYVDWAYSLLEASRQSARALVEGGERGPGGTAQARHEREILVEAAANRLAHLELGDQSLCFGRIDVARSEETFYIGRVSVADEHRDPVIVDWRAPVAEAFYRATGREPMGLARRRHFVSRGRTLLGLEDEFFGEATAELDTGRRRGEGALIAALEESRTGRLGDIVATIQAEQDAIIRAPLPGVLVVQGGPGTGKTVVALHRAAYLLYAHRFPLEGQGVLVIGPNRLFLSYIEQVLPSLGEAGVQISTLTDLVPDARANGVDRPDVARVKGDERMCRVLARAVRGRQRRLPRTIVIPLGVERVRITREDSAEIVAYARRRARTHNAGRKHAETAFYELVSSKLRHALEPEVVRERLRSVIEAKEVLERVWPVLTPAQLLNDLMGSPALLRHAASDILTDTEIVLLERSRADDASSIVWKVGDVPLLDEANELLGRRGRGKALGGAEAVRTYGHIVVDEAQDLSAMDLRVIQRRSLGGSMTLVGDVAQATAAAALDGWDAIVAKLSDRHPPRRSTLGVGYRLPQPTMDLAARLLTLAAPGVEPPESVRTAGDAPVTSETSLERFADDLVGAVRRETAAVGSGSVAVIVPDEWVERVEIALESAGLDFGRAHRGTLDRQVTVAPVRVVKGLELDSCIVVDPAAILNAEYRGAQTLYVALTRATKRLTLLSIGPMPEVLRDH